MANRIQVRRDTAANWTSANPVLAAGEPALETDTGRRKTGDGATAWTALPYVFDKTIADGIYTTPAAADAAYAPITGSANYLAPGQLDAATAAQVNTPTSATATALNATYDRVWGVLPSDTTAQIIAKAQAAYAAGGGMVKFPAGRWTLTQSLPYLAGVLYKGVKPVLQPTNVTNTQYMPDGPNVFSNGTVLADPTNSFPAFAANNVPQGSIQTDIGDTQIANGGIIGIGTDGFTHGIQIGATNIMGPVWGEIDDFYAINYSQWGVDIANMQHMKIGTIRTFERDTGTPGGGGQRYESRLPYLTLIPGNSNALELFHRVTNQAQKSRGIVIGGDPATFTSQLGGVDVGKLQVNAYNKNLISQTATFTNASTSVTVTDGTQFLPGMAVNFTAAGYGFTVSTIYIVQSVTGNTLTLSVSKQAAPVSASGAGTLTIQSYGFPNAEFTNFGSSNIHDLDLEGVCSVALYVENTAQANFEVRTLPTTTLVDLVGRSATRCHFNVSPLGTKTDFDGNSTSGSQFFGGRSNTYGRPLMGLFWDAQAGGNALQIGGGDTGQQGGDISARANGFLYPGGHGIGEKVYIRNSNITLAGSTVGNVVVTTSSNLTFTLPTITTSVGASAGTSIVGGYFLISNVATGTTTLATSGGQLFNNKAGVTGLTIGPGATLKVIACEDGGNLFWLATPGTLA